MIPAPGLTGSVLGRLAQSRYTVTREGGKFDLQFLYRFVSTYSCQRRSTPQLHCLGVSAHTVVKGDLPLSYTVWVCQHIQLSKEIYPSATLSGCVSTYSCQRRSTPQLHCLGVSAHTVVKGDLPLSYTVWVCQHIQLSKEIYPSAALCHLVRC